MNTANIVQKLLNNCNVLRDGGMSNGDYEKQTLSAMVCSINYRRSGLPAAISFSIHRAEGRRSYRCHNYL